MGPGDVGGSLLPPEEPHDALVMGRRLGLHGRAPDASPPQALCQAVSPGPGLWPCPRSPELGARQQENVSVSMPTTFLRSPSWQLPPPLPNPKSRPSASGPAPPPRLPAASIPGTPPPSRQPLVWRRGRTQPSQGFQAHSQGPRGRRRQQAGYFGGRPLSENRAGMLEAEHGVPEGWVRP